MSLLVWQSDVERDWPSYAEYILGAVGGLVSFLPVCYFQRCIRPKRLGCVAVRGFWMSGIRGVIILTSS